MSIGSPTLCMGIILDKSFFAFGFVFHLFCIGVSIGPGKIEFDLMFLFAYWIDIDLDKRNKAALDDP